MHQTKATILRLTKLTDTSLIVHWFTDEHGWIKTVAKGARRAGSPFAGRLDLFLTADIQYQLARRGELHGLREVKVEKWREGLRKNYESMLFGAYCTQLVEESMELEHPDERVHDLLIRALDCIAVQPLSSRIFDHYEKEMAKLLGIYHVDRLAAQSLREHLGKLPEIRGEIVERLKGREG